MERAYFAPYECLCDRNVRVCRVLARIKAAISEHLPLGPSANDSPTILSSIIIYYIIRCFTGENFTQKMMKREKFLKILRKMKEHRYLAKKSLTEYSPTYTRILQGRYCRQCFLIGHRRHDNDPWIHNLDRHSKRSVVSRTCACELDLLFHADKAFESGFLFGLFFPTTYFLLKNRRQLYAAVERYSR